MLYVTSARYESGYKIRVEFSDGTRGVVDLEDDLWGPVFEPLKDKELFRRFSVHEAFQTIVWENGADVAPEHLYEKLAGSPLQRANVRGAESK
jgi:hypothetical protein